METALDVAQRTGHADCCAALERSDGAANHDATPSGGGAEGDTQTASGNADLDPEPQTPIEIQEVSLVRIEQHERALAQAKAMFKGAGGVLQEEVDAAAAKAEEERCV